MFKKIALVLATLLMASGAWAYEDFPAWKPSGTLAAGQTATQILDVGGGSTFSNALRVENTAGIIVSFDPDRLTAGGASIIGLYHCPDDVDASAATRCNLIATLNAQTLGDYYAITSGYLRTYKSTAPAGAVEAMVTVKSLMGSAGGSGAGGSYFSGLPSYAEPQMKDAANRFLFDEHLMNTGELDSASIALIDPTDFASMFGVGGGCQLGQAPGAVFLVNDMTGGDCTQEVGGGSITGLCACSPTTATAYGPANILPGASGAPEPILGGVQHYWGYSATAPGINPSVYPPSVYSYEQPMIRLDPLGANGCSTAMEGSHAVEFQGQQKPAWFVRVQNNNPSDAGRGAEMQQMVAWFGWSNSLANAGFSHFIDPAGTTPATVLIEADIDNGFGFLWIGPSQSWYSVWIRNGSLSSAEIVNFPGAMTPGTAFYDYIYSTTNYARIQLMAGTMLGGFGFDPEPNVGGTKWAGYSIGKTKKAAFTPATTSPQFLLGNMQTRTGYYRVATACGIPSATEVTLRFELSQMDVIK